MSLTGPSRPARRSTSGSCTRRLRVRILHKEERDIVEENELPYDDCRTRLDEARVEFRRLNRQIRAASFEVEVEYADEEEQE